MDPSPPLPGWGWGRGQSETETGNVDLDFGIKSNMRPHNRASTDVAPGRRKGSAVSSESRQCHLRAKVATEPKKGMRLGRKDPSAVDEGTVDATNSVNIEHRRILDDVIK